MRIDEYEKELKKLTPKKFELFKKDLGGDQKTIEECVRYYVHHPGIERRICHLLGLKTEIEKNVEASVETANAAKESATSAKWSMIGSILAAIGTVAMAIYMWVKS
jgi:hypothetical protein